MPPFNSQSALPLPRGWSKITRSGVLYWTTDFRGLFRWSEVPQRQADTLSSPSASDGVPRRTRCHREAANQPVLSRNSAASQRADRAERQWLPFVDAFRTLCFDPSNEARDTFEALRFLKTAG